MGELANDRLLFTEKIKKDKINKSPSDSIALIYQIISIEN